MKNINIQKYYQQIICQDLLLKQNYKNVMELPKINSIILNTTSHLFIQDKKYIIPSLVALEFITGQKIKSTSAKKSIATFKIRQNQVLGCKLTLRNKYMYNFLSKFARLIAPRVRDFFGITFKNLNTQTLLSSCKNNIFALSNVFSKEKTTINKKITIYFTIGVTNLMIFPELENHFELFETSKGLNITFGISTKKLNDVLLLCSAFQLLIIK